MSRQSAVFEQLALSGSRRRNFAGNTLSDYWALTKPEINVLILITTGVGFYLGCGSAGRPFSFLGLFNTLLGTLLVASGTGALNQHIERNFDAQMRRTARRPAAAGRLKPPAVLAFGITLAVVGIVYLALAVNLLASGLAGLTLLIYLSLYTPLKRKTPLCVLVGALPGAMPPLIGWAAAADRLNGEAWLLYSILFLWQFPHFMAIAWMYREDYDRAGYLVLPKGNARISFVTLQTLFPLLALVAISVVQFPARHAAISYCAEATLSFGFLYFGLEFVIRRSGTAARRLLATSIVYLPLLFALNAVRGDYGKEQVTAQDGVKVFIAPQRDCAKPKRILSLSTLQLLRGAEQNRTHHGFNLGCHVLGGDTVGSLKPTASSAKNGPSRGGRQHFRIDTGWQPMKGETFLEHILDDGDDRDF